MSILRDMAVKNRVVLKIYRNERVGLIHMRHASKQACGISPQFHMNICRPGTIMMIGAIINLTKFNELDNAQSHRRDINCVLLMACQDRRSQGAGLKNKLIFDPKIEQWRCIVERVVMLRQSENIQFYLANLATFQTCFKEKSMCIK